MNQQKNNFKSSSASKRRLLIALLTVSGMCVASQAHAVTGIWSGPGTDLSTPANWSTASVPGIADEAQFKPASTVSPTSGSLDVLFVGYYAGVPSLDIGGPGSITIETGGNIDTDLATNPQTISIATVTLLGNSKIIGSTTVGGTASLTFANTSNVTMGIGSVTAAHSAVNINAATFAIAGTGTVAGNTGFFANGADITASTRINLANAVTTFVTASGGFNDVFNGGFSGTGSIQKLGLGKLHLGASDSAWAGTIALGSANGTSYGNIEIDSVNSLGAAGNITSGNTDLGRSAKGALEINNVGAPIVSNEYIFVRGRSSAVNPQILNTAGNNTFAGTVAVDTAAGGGSNIVFQSNAGLLQFTGTLDHTFTIPETLNLIGSGDGVVSGLLKQTGVGAIWNVTKNGAGTWTISGPQTYTGTTTVTTGTLLLNATHTLGGNYTVASGATLGGSGSTTSAVSGAGSVAPGNSIGTLAVGSFDVDTLAIEFSTVLGTTDLLNVAGNLDFGNITFANIGPGTPTIPLVFATYATSSGIPSFTAPTGYNVVIGPTSAALVAVAVPEPSTLILSALGLVGLGGLGLRQRRKK